MESQIVLKHTWTVTGPKKLILKGKGQFCLAQP